MAENKTLLLLALVGGAGFYLYSKSSAAAPAAATSPAASGAETGGATLNPAAAALANAATSPALKDVPDDVAQLAFRVNVDLATTLAVVKYDAIINDHPNELSTRYFLAEGTGPDTWQAAVRNFNESGLVELAQQVSVDAATVLAVVVLNTPAATAPTWFGGTFRQQAIKLATMQVIAGFRNDRNSWATAYASYRATNGLSGLVSIVGSESALNAVTSAIVPQYW